MAGNDTNTKILLHCNGTNGGTTFTDDCAGATAHTFTAHSATTDTGTVKFGSASMALGSTGYVDTPDSADFTIGSGEFTVDCWFNRQGGDGSSRYLFGQSNSSGSNASSSAAIRLTAANVLEGFVCVGGTAFTITGATSLTATGWHHVALLRTSTSLKMFLDGTQEGSTVSVSGTINDSANNLAIGRLGEFTTQTWNGFVDEFRFSNIARWTANFSVPTSEYSGGTFLTLTAAVATFTFTGYSVVKLLSRATAVGAYTFTGQVCTRAITRATAVGTYTYTGIASVMVKSKNLVAAVGTYTYTGIAAILNSVRTLTAARGTYVYTGFSALLVKTRQLAAVTGAYAMTGIATILHRGIYTTFYNTARNIAPRLLKSRVRDPKLGD